MLPNILTRKAVNRTAAIVTGKGTHYVPNKKIQTHDNPLPIAIRKLQPPECDQPNFIDLTGQRVGRFTVLGLALDHKRQWVVRCDCGTYSLRRAKAIKNPDNTQDRCEHCRHLAFLQRNERWRRTGKDTDIKDF